MWPIRTPGAVRMTLLPTHESSSAPRPPAVTTRTHASAKRLRNIIRLRWQTDVTRHRSLFRAHELENGGPGVLSQGLVAGGVLVLAGVPPALQLLALLPEQRGDRLQLHKPGAVAAAQIDFLKGFELPFRRVDERQDRVEDLAGVAIGVGAAGLAVGDEADVEIGLEVMGGGQGAEGLEQPGTLLRRLRRDHGRFR